MAANLWYPTSGSRVGAVKREAEGWLTETLLLAGAGLFSWSPLLDRPWGTHSQRAPRTEARLCDGSRLSRARSTILGVLPLGLLSVSMGSCLVDTRGRVLRLRLGFGNTETGYSAELLRGFTRSTKVKAGRAILNSPRQYPSKSVPTVHSRPPCCFLLRL